MKKNILFVLPFIPYPLVTGGHQGMFNGIDCVKDDFNIFIAYYVDWGADDSAAEEFKKHFPNATLLPMDNRIKPSTFKARVIGKLQRMLAVEEKKCVPLDKNTKYDLWLWTDKPQPARWQEFIYDACLKYHIDIAQVEMPWISSFILSLPDTVKKVYLHHELAFVRHQLELQEDPDNLYAHTCYLHSLATELNMLNHADAVITVSEIDKNKLENAGVTTPIYASFSVLDETIYENTYVSGEKMLSFVGSSKHVVNKLGLRWFLDNCWNRLKAKEPSYRLKIIGEWDEKSKQEIFQYYSDIEFLGFVENLYEVIKGTVMIVPITIGSGIRMKILEAASKGVPFVSTTVGAEGIPVIDGHDCFITDDPLVFVDDIIKLQDEKLKISFIQNAKMVIENNYSKKALRDNRLKIYNSLFNN